MDKVARTFDTWESTAMTRYLASNDEGSVRQFVREWVALLSQGRFDEAHEWLYRADRFGPLDLRESIYRYSADYNKLSKRERESFSGAVVDHPSTMALNAERFDYYELIKPDEHGRPAYGVEYFLSMNGRRSSVAVSFFLRAVGDGSFGLELTDISMA